MLDISLYIPTLVLSPIVYLANITTYEKPIKNIPLYRATTLHFNRLAFRILLVSHGINFTNNDHTHKNTQTTHYDKYKRNTWHTNRTRHCNAGGNLPCDFHQWDKRGLLQFDSILSHGIPLTWANERHRLNTHKNTLWTKQHSQPQAVTLGRLVSMVLLRRSAPIS